MRDQYAGDLSDLIKFSFLRAVTSNIRLGVAWYYLENHDGRADGRHREYLNEPHWSGLDQDVFHTLKAGMQSVQELERAPFWRPSTRFYRAPVPNGQARESWFTDLIKALTGSELVFVDPDIGFSLKPSQKHVSGDELARLYQEFGSVVLIQFPSRSKTHELSLAQTHRDLLDICDCETVVTLRTTTRVPTWTGSSIPRQRWFTLIGGSNELRARVSRFAKLLSRMPQSGAQVNESQRARAGKPRVEKRQRLRLNRFGSDRVLLLPEHVWNAAGIGDEVELHLTETGLAITAAK